MTDVFNDDAGNQSGSVNQNDNAQNDLFLGLVGEGKKFKTPVDLAKGKLEADAFIEKVKEENKELRARLEGLEAIVKAVKPAASDGVKPDAVGSIKAPVDADKIDELVAAALERKTTDAQRAANLKGAVDALEQSLGDKAAVASAIASKASELGMTREKLKEMAETSPAAFLTLMGANGQGNSKGTPPASSASKGGHVAPKNTSGVKNWAYFESLRKEMGSKYYQPSVQNELFKARRELGDKFYQ